MNGATTDPGIAARIRSRLETIAQVKGELKRARSLDRKKVIRAELAWQEERLAELKAKAQR